MQAVRGSAWLLSIASVIILLGVWPENTTAQSKPASYSGQTVAQVLDQFRREGLPLVYSTNLVPDSLRVGTEPEPGPGPPLDIIAAILAPHKLKLQAVENVYLVVRTSEGQNPSSGNGSLLLFARSQASDRPLDNLVLSSKPALPRAESLGQGVYRLSPVVAGQYRIQFSAEGYGGLEQVISIEAGRLNTLSLTLDLQPAELADMTISTSRYRLNRELINSLVYFDQRAIQNLPDIGDDPVRAVQRLPGAAAGGFSAQSSFRGGEQNETAIFLNGLQLLDPFHIRDYHSVFSAIDVRAIKGIEVFTGGFPVRYGDRMSGLVLIDSQEPDKPQHTELGLSVFNTSALTSGYRDINGRQIDWLVSARKSNLDIVLDPDVGEPDYHDIFTQFGFSLSPDTRISGNTLLASDEVLVITENEIGEREESRSNTRNKHFWLRLDNVWNSDLSSATVLSNSALNNRRNAFINDPEKVFAKVQDLRKIDKLALRQDWSFTPSNQHLLQWGFEFERLKAEFDYQSNAEYLGLFSAYPGVPDAVIREVRTNPDGNSYGAYLSDRWQISEKTIIESGLRWDKQTYTDNGSDNQFSPRFSLLHSIRPDLDLRFSWGRFHQAQDIDELQVEDGIDRYFPAQRTDQLIAGFQYRYKNDYSIRVEAFYKDISMLKPRFENLFDSLALIPELQPDRVRLEPESARAYGLELSLDYRAGQNTSWWASYSWSKTSDTINGQREARSWDQRHALQAGLAWQRGPWETGVAINIHSGWPTTGMALEVGDEEDEFSVMPGPRNIEQLSTFASLDFRVSREFNVKHGRLTGFFEMANTLNRNNPCCVDFDVDEDEDGALFLDRTEDFWLPLLPAIGVLWEF